MINYNKFKNQLATLANNESLWRQAIIKKSDSQYWVFGKYDLTKAPVQGWSVSQYGAVLAEFRSLKSAIAFLIAKESAQRQFAKYIAMVDHQLAAVEANIAHSQHFIESSEDPEKKAIALTRMGIYLDRYRELRKDLQKIYNQTKYLN